MVRIFRKGMKRTAITAFNLSKNLEKQFAEDEDFLKQNFTNEQIEIIKERVNLAKYRRAQGEGIEYAFIIQTKTMFNTDFQIVLAKRKAEN